VLLLTTWFGSFLLEGDRVVAQRLFPKEPPAIADRLAMVEEWRPLEEERDLVAGLQEYFVLEPRLERMGGNMTEEAPPFLDPETFGYPRKLLHDAMVIVAEGRMRRAVGPDDHAIQAVRALEDLQATANLIVGRLKEWYSLHFPELPRLVDEGRLLELVATHGAREGMPASFGPSVGADLGPEDEAALRGLATMALEVRRAQRALEAHLASRMATIAPNLARLVGPVLGARLLAHAGGLRELAMLPASTVQLLGAEKALFRHLRTGSNPPKHGVLFQHPWVHAAPPWQRGAVARALANRVCIAARADGFTGRFIAEELRGSMEKELQEVARRHPKPKDTVARTKGRRGRGPGGPQRRQKRR
jgi:nucleolar protein 56